MVQRVLAYCGLEYHGSSAVQFFISIFLSKSKGLNLLQSLLIWMSNAWKRWNFLDELQLFLETKNCVVQELAVLIHCTMTTYNSIASMLFSLWKLEKAIQRCINVLSKSFSRKLVFYMHIYGWHCHIISIQI